MAVVACRGDCLADVCHGACQRLRRTIIDATALGEPERTVRPPIAVQLVEIGNAYRMHHAVVLAAYKTMMNRLDAGLWAAHEAGLSYREISDAAELPIKMVQTRVQSFSERLLTQVEN